MNIRTVVVRGILVDQTVRARINTVINIEVTGIAGYRAACCDVDSVGAIVATGIAAYCTAVIGVDTMIFIVVTGIANDRAAAPYEDAIYVIVIRGVPRHGAAVVGLDADAIAAGSRCSIAMGCVACHCTAVSGKDAAGTVAGS